VLTVILVGNQGVIDVGLSEYANRLFAKLGQNFVDPTLFRKLAGVSELFFDRHAGFRIDDMPVRVDRAWVVECGPTLGAIASGRDLHPAALSGDAPVEE